LAPHIYQIQTALASVAQTLITAALRFAVRGLAARPGSDKDLLNSTHEAAGDAALVTVDQ
jgi:hypothetical protein